MTTLTILAAVTLQAMPADTPRAVLDSATLASAYLDRGAQELVERARARRREVDRSIRAYETVVRVHLSAGLRAGWVERMLYRRDTAARIHWQRDDTVRIEVLGAREVVPIGEAAEHVPGDLNGLLPHLAFDPAEQERLIGLSDVDFVQHPLAPGSEAYYRFRSGDTTEVRLPEGPTVRLIELEVLPRRPSPTIIRGSLWFDADSHGLVRARFRLAEEINTGTWKLQFETRVVQDSLGADTVTSVNFGVLADVEREPRAGDAGPGPEGERGEQPDDVAERDEGSDMGLFARSALRLGLAMLPDIEGRFRYVTIDYGLWGMQWWLPRLVAFEGVVEVAGLEAPVRYERRYGAYTVLADSAPAAAPPVSAPDSTDQRAFIVSVPDDTASLLVSELLPGEAFDPDARLIDDAELEAVLGQLSERGGFEAGAGAPWDFAWSGIDWDPLFRYNRVEALSLGLRAEVDPGPIQVAASARIGTGDVDPRGSVSLVRRSGNVRYQLTGYRRLETMDRRLGFSNVASASALLFGYDEAEYYDALGVSLSGRPPASVRPLHEWRLYAQREAPVRKHTDFSVPHLFDASTRFRANRAASEAVQYGVELALRRWWGRDPDGFRWGGELRLGAATGGFTYARPSLSLRTTFPLPGSFVAALEAGAGAVWGDAGLQHLRRVGGTPSVRGYHGSALVGESSWRLRAELATRLPLARLVLFSDAGWAGRFDRFGEAEPLVSAGIGASFLDGLIRIDVARALVAPTGWGVALYVDGPL